MTFDDLKAEILSRVKSEELCAAYQKALIATTYDELIAAASVKVEGVETPFVEWVYLSGVVDESLFAEFPEVTLNDHGIYINNVTLTNPCGDCDDTATGLRFGFPGEDDLGAEDRSFDADGNDFAIDNAANLSFGGFGAGAHTGTPTKLAAFDSSGKVIEVDPASVGTTPPTPGIDTVLAVGQSLTANRTITGAGFYTSVSGGRFETGKGANVAAANNLTLGNDGNMFTITGNTQINAITTTNWLAGSKVTLIFTGTPVIKHNTAGGAGTAKILLSGSVDYTAAADDTLQLSYDGTSWHEVGRKLAATSGITSLSNGQGTTANGSAIDLGSASNSGAPLTQTRFINTGVNTLRVRGSSAGQTLQAENTGNGYAATFEATTGVAAQALVVPSSTSTIAPVFNLLRASSGTAANGIGAGIDYYIQTVASGSVYAGSYSIKWKNATGGSRTSEAVITAVNNTVTVDVFKIGGEGYVQLRALTATEASAITAIEGMIVFVNTTNATFTSVGFWGYDGGAWNKF